MPTQQEERATSFEGSTFNEESAHPVSQVRYKPSGHLFHPSIEFYKDFIKVSIP